MLVARDVPAPPGARERCLLLVLVVLAHAAGAVALTRLDTPVKPVVGMPITVALIDQATAEPATVTEREIPPAAAPQAPHTPAEPPPSPPTRVEIPPKPLPLPEARPEPLAPVTAPEQPESRPQPAPKLPVVEPEPVPDTPSAAATAEAQSQPVESAVPARPAPEPAVAVHPTARSQSAAVTAARFDAAYLNNPPPVYPRLSRRMGEEGRVLLRVFVTADGSPGQIELAESSGSTRLDTAAAAAVSGWRFVPARQGDRSIDAWVIVPIVFKLEGR